MREVKVWLNSINKVQKFVKAVSESGLDVELTSLNNDNPYVLNAQSLLCAFMCLDLANPVNAELVTTGKDAEKEFIIIMTPFSVNDSQL